MTTHVSTRLVWLDRAKFVEKREYCGTCGSCNRRRCSLDLPTSHHETLHTAIAARGNLVTDRPSSGRLKLGISREYAQKLPPKDAPNDFRLPDFTVSFEGDTFYWEHLGMLSVPSYKEAWNRKRQWYEFNGFFERVITSEDGSDGSIDAVAIERIARKTILLEG